MTLVSHGRDPAPPTGSVNGADLVLPVARHRPRRDPNWLLQQLPHTMVSADFFARFVSIFQDLGGDLLDNADGLEHLVDVSVASPEMVRWLGAWVGVSTLDDSQDVARQRRIVASAARTLTSRGTRGGLTEFLALLTGHVVCVEDGGGVFAAESAPDDPAWVRIWLRDLGGRRTGDNDSSSDSEEDHRDLAEFVTVLRDEIPAHVRAELYVGGTLRWTTEKGIYL